jgi:hypothetical protein
VDAEAVRDMLNEELIDSDNEMVLEIKEKLQVKYQATKSQK